MSDIFRNSLNSAEEVRQLEKCSLSDMMPVKTIYEALKIAANRSPEKSAIKHIETPEDLSPRDINFATYLSLVEQAANLFYRHSAGNPPIVAVIGPYLPETLIAMWGGAVAGRYVPINPFLSLEHTVEIIKAAKATILVTANSSCGANNENTLAAIKKSVTSLKTIFLYGDATGEEQKFNEALKESRTGGLDFNPASSGDIECAYMHTGGTTGAPKLVRHSHQGQLIQAWLCGIAMGPDEDAIVGHAMPNFHLGGAIANALRCLLFRQTLVSLTPDGFRNKDLVPRFWDIVERFGMTSITTAPTTIAAVLSHDGPGPATLKEYTSGGSSLARELIHSFHRKYGIWLKEVWGGTEFHGILSFHYGSDVEPRIGSCGRVVPFHKAMSAILEGNKFVRAAEPGERGTIIAAGPTTMSGFVDSSKDSEFFIEGGPDELQWATTGDIGFVDEDHFIWIYGREKDVIIRGGHNIDSAMIDDALMSHPDVLHAAAVGKPDASKGELPMAYIELRPNAKTTADEILLFAQQNIPERAAVPVEIVVIDAIPLTGVGKVSKPPLRNDAILRVVKEQCLTSMPTESISIKISEDGGRTTAIVELAQDSEAETENKIKKLEAALGPFTFAFKVEALQKSI